MPVDAAPQASATVIVGVSGASGAPLALKLIRELAAREMALHLVFSETASRLFLSETGVRAELSPILAGVRELKARVELHSPDDFAASISSGSSRWDAMVVCPASMGTVARIASGTADNLITRCADVALKERRKLILVPRETPLSAIHLENLLKLARLGAIILPPMLGFYFQPKSLEDEVNFVVGRILDHLGIPHSLFPRWGE